MSFPIALFHWGAGCAILCILVGCSSETSSDTAVRPHAVEEASGFNNGGIAPSNAVVSEPTFQEQVEAVQSGESRQIVCTAYQPTAQELAVIGELQNLQVLQLDAGVRDSSDILKLPPHNALVHFRLRLTSVRVNELQHIIDCFPKLAILNVPVLQIDQGDSIDFASLETLTSLRLGGAGIDTSFVESFASLPRLQHVHLIQPSLVDSDLQIIARIERLRSFYLDSCSLSDEAWQAFFAAKPNVHVHLDQAHLDYDPRKH